MGYTVLASGALGFATSHTIPSAGTVTPTPGKLILLAYRSAILSGTLAPPTASGCGLSFDAVTGATAQIVPSVVLGFLRAMDSLAEEGTIAVSFGGATQSLRYALIEIDDDLEKGANGANAIANAVQDDIAFTAGALDVAFAAFSDAANPAVAATMGGVISAALTIAPRSGWTETYDDGAALEVQYRADEDSACGATWTGGGAGTVYVFGMELLRATGPITAEAGVLSLSGQVVRLAAGRALVAAQGSYAVAGQVVRLAAGRALVAAQGS
jgi:hypothetical protein